MLERLLVLGAGHFQLPAICTAKQMGFEVIATDANPSAEGLASADFSHTVDLKDIEGCLSLAKHYQISGVLTVASDIAIISVAAIAEQMGLPGPGVPGATIATNKALMRTLFLNQDIPSPDFKLCTNREELKLSALAIGYPLVTKPIDNAGSRGISYVDNNSDLDNGFVHALEHSRSGQILVEEYMPGIEMSVEGFVYHGKFVALALSDKQRTPPPYLLDTTVTFPSLQPSDVQEEATVMVKRAVELSGLDNATIHAEVMVTESGPKMVEYAARGAGFKVFTDMLPLVTGVDVVRELINISVGRTPSLNPSCHRASVLRFPAAPPGRVMDILGVEEAKAIPGVVEFELFVTPGDEVKPLTSGSERVGYFVTSADCREEAESIMEQVESTFSIIVEESPKPVRN